jgi:glycosyltransferase involved in cell wall biosynthesis
VSKPSVLSSLSVFLAMRILILTQFFDPEPASIPGLPFASWLQSQGHNVEVITGFPNYPGGKFYPGTRVALWRRDEFESIRVNRVLLYPSHNGSAVSRMVNYSSFAISAATIGSFLTRRPDVVYVYHPPGSIALPAFLWRYMRGVPFLYHVQDLWPDSVVSSGMVTGPIAARTILAMLHLWSRWTYRAASAIVTISPGMRLELIGRGVPAEKVHSIPNWVEETIYFPYQRDESLAEKLGFAGRFNVVYSGNLGVLQDLNTVVDAAELLREKEKIQFVIIGSGQVERELQESVQQRRLSNVRFLGRMPYRDMAPITALADVMLVTLRGDAFLATTIPSKTQVALASAKPVIMAVAGDAADMVLEAGAGVAAPPGDAAALAAAVLSVEALPPADLTEMGQRGRDYYVQNLSLDSGARKIEKLLTSITESFGLKDSIRT